LDVCSRLLGLFDYAGEPSSRGSTAQRSPPPLPRSTRFPSSTDNHGIEEYISGLQQPRPPLEPILKETTPPPPIISPLSTPKTSLIEPKVLPPATDVPRLPSEPRQLTSSKIPSSRIGRLFHYGGESLYVCPPIEVLTKKQVWQPLSDTVPLRKSCVDRYPAKNRPKMVVR
jgi:hypothetical protein